MIQSDLGSSRKKRPLSEKSLSRVGLCTFLFRNPLYRAVPRKYTVTGFNISKMWPCNLNDVLFEISQREDEITYHKQKIEDMTILNKVSLL